MWLNQDSLARSLVHTTSTSEVCIHIYPSISISRTTQKYSTPNPGENSQKHSPISVFPCEINAQVIMVTTTCYIISGDKCSKKRNKIRKNMRKQKGASARNLERKEKKVRREVKMDKCPIVELGVQDTHLREKKKKIQSISFSLKVSKEQERYVSPQKSTSRIRLSPLLSLSLPYTIHSPHMHILI